MATERTNDMILDVLYGENDAESGEAIELSAQELAELEQWREFRATLGRELPVVEPNPSVRASLLAAAAAELSQSVDEIAGEAVRRPPSERESQRGFWSKLASGQGSQIALVATVLLVGAFAFNFLNVNTSMAPAYEEVGYPSVAAPEPSIVKPDPVPAPAPAPTAAVELEEIAQAEAAEDSVAYRGRGEGRAVERAAKPTKMSSEGGEGRSPKAVGRAAAPSPKPKPSMLNNMDEIDVFADERKPSSSNVMPSTAKRESMPLEDSLDKELAIPSMMEKKAKADMARTDDVKVSKSASVEKKEVAATSGTLDAVEEAYRSRDYRRVITQADSVIEAGASAVQRARALELKAQAYRQMGMLSQSLTTYRNLEANYPTYQGDRVRASRQEVERQIQSTSKPKQPNRSSTSYDFSNENVPSSTD